MTYKVDPTPDPTDEVEKLLQASIRPVVLDSALAVVIVRGETLQILGTANILRLGDALYAITASHVVRAGMDEPGSMFLWTPKGPVEANGMWYATPLPGFTKENDPFDLAVTRIADSNDAHFDGVIPITLENLFPESIESYPAFAMAGYPTIVCTPGELPGTSPKFVAMCITTILFKGDTAGLKGFDSKYHLLFRSEPGSLITNNGSPLKVELKSGYVMDVPGDLGGISGVAVWTVGKNGIDPRTFPTLTPKLVAIETSVYPKRGLIRGTTSSMMLAFIALLFPELKKIIELWTPS